MSSPLLPDSPASLEALRARLIQDLHWLDLPPKPWVPSRRHGDSPMLDVAIVGGGMAGLTAAAALRLLGIDVEVFDSAPRGFEGPWVTTARMETLRSPKQLAGPAMGLPALTFRAWFESQFGGAAWEALDKIPRVQWMDYLRWLRDTLEAVLGVKVSNEHRVRAMTPEPSGNAHVVVLDIDSPQGTRRVVARRAILATGRDGLGGAYVPVWVHDLPRALWAHSSDDWSPEALAGKRVGVIGASAAAMDSAATALEAGAARVDLLIRRATFPLINKSKGSGNPGLTHGYAQLPDEWKWRIRRYLNVQQLPPPRGSTLRVSRHAHAFFNFDSPVQAAKVEHRVEGDVLSLTTPHGTFVVDYLLLSTGFRIDWASRPEMAALAPFIKSWGDVWQPAAGDEDDSLSISPVLGAGFEFQERHPGERPGLSNVHCFCYPAVMSHGPTSGDIPAISDGARRMASAIASRLYGEDIESHFDSLQAYADPELLGDEWQPAVPLAR